MNRMTCIIAFVLLGVDLNAADPVQLPVTKDNSIVLVDGEWTENGGQRAQIRIKANQHIVAMDFDTSAIAGKRVRKATLVSVQSDERISGVTISTIPTPWNENTSNGLTAGVEGIDDWGYKGARFPAVTGGNAFTLTQQVDSEIRDGKYHWDVSPDIVHALAIGVARGIAIHEHDDDVGRNPTIFSREQSGKAPVLIVELDDTADAVPSPPRDLQMVNADSTSAQLMLTPPEQGFAYEVLIDGVPLGRHNIPMVSRDRNQVIFLRDLPASIRRNGLHEISIVTLNRTGQRSGAAVIRSEIVETGSIEKPSAIVTPAQSSSIDGVSVIPVTDKYDSTATAVGDLPEDYRTRNVLFDGRRVRLIAAAGEVVGFQVLLKGRGSVSVKVKLDDPKVRLDLWQAVYVPSNERWIPDPLLPMPAAISLRPDVDNVVVADIYIPFDTAAGFRKGSITISDGRVVPLEIEVLPFSLPRQATFFCEMNGYGLPDHVNDYYALQQVAYDHRVHANILHYSHHTAAPGARKSNLDMQLRSGRRMDNRRYDNIQPDATAAYWDDFVEAFGPYIDGSLFKDGHRGPVPAPGFYLTFHESWPLNCREFFNGNPDAFLAFSDQPAYARTYVNILRNFRTLAKSRGWTQTGFQVYFNNKGSLSEKDKAPWILDEPASFWDYRALQFYGELTDRGRTVAPDVQINYRIDISRPEFCRGQLDHRDDLWVVSSWAFQHYLRLVKDRLEHDGLTAWVYGTTNHVHESNRNVQAWALDSWQHGATGIVPWQTINKTGSALKEADQLGLFIFDQNELGETAIRHSIRLKAYREAQQLIEYLNLLQQKRGWSEDQLQRFITQYVDLNAEVSKIDEADAGTTAYGRLSPSGMELLRLATARLLH